MCRKHFEAAYQEHMGYGLMSDLERSARPLLPLMLHKTHMIEQKIEPNKKKRAPKQLGFEPHMAAAPVDPDMFHKP